MPGGEVASFYNIPKPRQEWIKGKFVQRHEKNEEAWVELYNDLVYVVLLSKLGDLLVNCSHNVFQYFKIGVLFWSMCLTRQAIDEYANRFYSHDLAHKVLYLIYTSGVFVQVLNINRSSGSKDLSTVKSHSCEYISVFGTGLAVGVLITRISIILSYWSVFYHNDAAQKQFMFDVFRWSVTACLSIAIIILHYVGLESDGLDIILLGISVLQEVVVWIVSRLHFRQYYKYPIDLDLMQARWGIWVMIVIGEAIIQMLYRTISSENLEDTYLMTLTAFVLMYSLAMQYYDACQTEWFDHAMCKSALNGVAWIWLHPCMTYHLFRVGAVFKVFMEAVKYHEDVEEPFVSIFSISLGVVTAVLTLIRMSNTMSTMLTRRQMLVFSARMALSGLQMSVCLWGYHNPITLLGIHTILSVGLFNTIDVVYDVLHARAKAELIRLQKEKNVQEKSLRKMPRQFSQLNLVASKRVLMSSINESAKSEVDTAERQQQAVGHVPFSSLQDQRVDSSNRSTLSGGDGQSSSRKEQGGEGGGGGGEGPVLNTTTPLQIDEELYLTPAEVDTVDWRTARYSGKKSPFGNNSGRIVRKSHKLDSVHSGRRSGSAVYNVEVEHKSLVPSSHDKRSRYAESSDSDSDDEQTTPTVVIKSSYDGFVFKIEKEEDAADLSIDQLVPAFRVRSFRELAATLSGKSVAKVGPTHARTSTSSLGGEGGGGGGGRAGSASSMGRKGYTVPSDNCLDADDYRNQLGNAMEAELGGDGDDDEERGGGGGGRPPLVMDRSNSNNSIASQQSNKSNLKTPSSSGNSKTPKSKKKSVFFADPEPLHTQAEAVNEADDVSLRK